MLGLAPHTSAGILGRIIGFTRASACYAHPFFHAAKRRNCDGDEDSIILLLDALLNFSLSFLPDKIGGRMDAPLVLIPVINPREVDKEAHNLSIMWEYPLDFYLAAELGKHPKEVAVETAATRIDHPGRCLRVRLHARHNGDCSRSFELALQDAGHDDG